MSLNFVDISYATSLDFDSGTDVRHNLSGTSRYQGLGILILPGKPLANGYYKWHPEKKGKTYMYTKQMQKRIHKNSDVKIIKSK